MKALTKNIHHIEPTYDSHIKWKKTDICESRMGGSK